MRWIQRGRRRLFLIACGLALAASVPARAQDVTYTVFATGMSQVVDIVNAGDDRLFAVQQSGIRHDFRLRTEGEGLKEEYNELG